MTEIRENQTAIPAAPGWGQVIPIMGEDGQVETFVLEPIVCWLVEHGRTAGGVSFAHCEPVTAMEGLDTANGMLQRPDGSYGEAYGGDFFSRDDVLKELRRQRAIEIQRLKGI